MKAIWSQVGRAVVLSLLALALFACGEASGPGRSGKPIVLVTVPPQAEMVRRIAGNLVEVEILVPPGSDPHTFEPSIEQMQAVSKASLYFLVGHPALEFETIWRERLAAEGTHLRFAEGSSGLELIPDDPHVWLSPRATTTMARNLTVGLKPILPGQEARLEAGLQRFLGEVDILDAEIRGILSVSPHRSFLVYHAAWGWFARDYGLEQIAIERGHSQPGPAHLAELIDRARNEQIDVVFVQPQVGNHQATAFAKEIGGRVVRVDPLAENWFDNLRGAARAFAFHGASGEGQ